MSLRITADESTQTPWHRPQNYVPTQRLLRPDAVLAASRHKKSYVGMHFQPHRERNPEPSQQSYFRSPQQSVCFHQDESEAQDNRRMARKELSQSPPCHSVQPQRRELPAHPHAARHNEHDADKANDNMQMLSYLILLSF